MPRVFELNVKNPAFAKQKNSSDSHIPVGHKVFHTVYSLHKRDSLIHMMSIFPIATTISIIQFAWYMILDTRKCKVGRNTDNLV